MALINMSNSMGKKLQQKYLETLVTFPTGEKNAHFLKKLNYVYTICLQVNIF